MSATEIKSKIDEAITANEAGGHATALTKLRSARMLVFAKPDARQVGDELKWRTEIDGLMMSIGAEVWAAASIKRTRIVHAKPTD